MWHSCARRSGHEDVYTFSPHAFLRLHVVSTLSGDSPERRLLTVCRSRIRPTREQADFPAVQFDFYRLKGM